MHEVLRTLSEIGIVPVVALKDAADAVPLPGPCAQAASPRPR